MAPYGLSFGDICLDFWMAAQNFFSVYCSTYTVKSIITRESLVFFYFTVKLKICFF
jgi:hypothetical protein